MPKVIINYNDPRWKKYKIDFDKIVNATVGSTYADSEVSIVLTNDREIHSLNKKYRGIDRPTNVLSFETGDDILIGDIFISFDTVKSESGKQEFINHTTHMVVHGMLHLMGYDHLNDRDADKMESKEIGILGKLGIKNPYGEESKMKKILNKFKIRENGVLQYIAYFLLGGVASFGFAPFNLWFATLLGIGAAYYLTIRGLDSGHKNKFWKSFARVWPFGAGYAIGMFWWVLNSIYVVPELAAQFAIWTAPGILGLGVFGGIVFAIPFVWIRCMRSNPAHRPFLFAAIWTTVLWLREWLLTGFPWNPVANIAMPCPMLANSMSLWGALGLTFIIVGLIASIAEIIKNKKQKNIFIPLIIFTALVCAGFYFGYKNIKKSEIQSETAGPVIRIVQPAGSAIQKASHSREAAIANADKNIRNLTRLAKLNDEPVDLIIFPETTYPYMIANDDLPFAKELAVPTIIGATSYNDGRFYNSMLLVNSAGKINKIYSKSHLVPFGEYRPFGDIIPTPGQLTSGNGPEILTMDLNGREFRFAPAICYEVVFSDSLVPHGNFEQPHVIVNITNDTWFGKTPGTYQHLDMVRRYAIESGLPIIRANYSGISAFINSDGTVLASLPIGSAGALDGMVSGDHMTIYRYIGRDGFMIIILLFAIIAVLSIPGSRKKD